METDDSLPVLLLQTHFGDPALAFVAAFIIILLLLSIVTILSAAESAIASLSQDETETVEERSSYIDKMVDYLSDHIRLMRASCRVVQSVLLLLIAVIGVYGISMSGLSLPSIYVYTIAFVALTVLWLFFYGILPKIFLKNKLGTTRILAPLLKFVFKIGKPFVLLTPFPVENFNSEQPKKSQTLLENDAPSGIYEEKEMLEEIIHFYDKKAGEIMTPRTDIEAIDIRSNIDDVVKIIVDSGYSRIPVYAGNEDNIKGILYVKDIIPALKNNENKENIVWQSLIRAPYFVPESKKIEQLLGELRTNKTHLAIVVDEFGCTAGLVTMEDIIEEIIGEISDEYDQDEHTFKTLPDGSYIIEGKTQLNDFFRETGTPQSDFNELTEEAETLTGLLLAIKGTLPRRREIIDYKNYRFHILEADERRVLKVKFGLIKS